MALSTVSKYMILLSIIVFVLEKKVKNVDVMYVTVMYDTMKCTLPL
jgi:hypothetical protein